MKQKALIAKVEALEISVGNLKRQLVEAKVLRSMHDPYRTPISLEFMKDQINSIKDFLDIEFVREPAVPAKSVMRKRQTTEED